MGGGGAEKVLVDLVNSLDHNQYDIDVVSVLGGVHENRISPNVDYYKMIKTENKLLKNLFTKVFYHLPLSLIHKIIKKDEYDIEIAYLEGFPTRVIAAGKSNAKKLAFVHCDVSVHNVMNRLYKDKKDCLDEYNRFDKVCFVSNIAKTGYEKSVGKLDNCTVIHNVIDFQNVLIKARESIPYEYETDGLKLIAIGRLSQEKGNERLVKVVSELEKKYNFELWIIGDGDRRTAIEEMIKNLDIKSVKLMGFQTNPYAFMNKADLFVCPSFYEGYSTVAAEAMVIGLPALTTDCAGMDEILDNGKCGLIVDNSEEGIKTGLTTLLENNQCYLDIKKAAEEKKKSFNNGQAVKEYDELFKEILL